MKDITKIIARGGLTPFERVQIFVQNSLHKQETRKDLLPEADLRALTLTNQAKPHEIKEYNIYLAGWDNFEYLTLDVQTVYLKLMLQISRLQHFVQLVKGKKDAYIKRLAGDSYDDLFAFTLKHTGYKYDHLVHAYTYEHIPESLKQDMLQIDMYNDPEYWLQEVQLAEILTGNNELRVEDIEQLTDLIVGHIPWGHEFDLGLCKLSVKQCVFNGYFAGYPMIEFGRRIAAERDIDYESEDELRSILVKLPNLKHILIETVRESIKDGLFDTEYVPLCKSCRKKAVSGVTKQRHSDIMSAWMEARKETMALLNQQITSGELELKINNSRFFETVKETSYITGTSLYQAGDSLPYVSAYKAQIDTLVPKLYSHYFTQQANLMERYSTLLAYKEMADTASTLFDLPMSGRADDFLAEVRESIHSLYLTLEHRRDDIRHEQWKKDSPYTIETFVPELSIQLEDTKSAYYDLTKSYNDKFAKIFGGRWNVKD